MSKGCRLRRKCSLPADDHAGDANWHVYLA